MRLPRELSIVGSASSDEPFFSIPLNCEPDAFTHGVFPPVAQDFLRFSSAERAVLGEEINPAAIYRGFQPQRPADHLANGTQYLKEPDGKMQFGRCDTNFLSDNLDQIIESYRAFAR